MVPDPTLPPSLQPVACSVGTSDGAPVISKSHHPTGRFDRDVGLLPAAKEFKTRVSTPAISQDSS